ncbi:MAG: DUF1800 domain-containing protein [Burkholderiales bacterium]
MRSLRAKAVNAVACAGLLALPFVAQAAAVLGFDDARHLLARTSFAAPPEDIGIYAKLTREQAADRLLAAARTDTVEPPPKWTAEPFEPLPRLQDLTPEERRALQRDRRSKAIDLKAWWVEEMRGTPFPLTEKMTLFWHNHFVSSEQKVRVPLLMYRQNALLRRYALGNFGTLLHEIARDPAMVIYLDSASNRKGRPNENFAREVMELFTLGEGHYTEQDVKEAARAFTGWSFNRQSGEFVLRPFQHDDGPKTVLGTSGPLTGEDVLDILLAHPRTAEHIVEKLWREFVSPAPEPADVRRIARAFRDSRYDTRVALRALLVSDAFYSQQNRAALIKSPVDLVVGTLRLFRFSTGDTLPFVFTLAQLGQNLFAPPNVKGWPSGEAWINTTTLLARKQFLERLFRDEDAAGMQAGVDRMKGAVALDDGRERLARAMAAVKLDAPQWFRSLPGDVTEPLERAVLVTSPREPLPPGSQGLEALRMLTQDPVYQLK